MRRFLRMLPMLPFLFRCAGPLETRMSRALVSHRVLLERVGDHAARLRTFEGRGRTMMVSSDGGFRGTMRIAAKLPDSLWLKIEGPLGIDALRAEFGSGNVRLYYPRDQVVYTGELDVMQEYGFLPVDLGESDLVLAMLGLFVSGDVDSAAWMASDSRRVSMLTIGGDSLCVDARGPVVSFWSRRDSTGASLWQWQGDDFRTRGGILLPMVVRMTQYRPPQRVTFFYDRIAANRPLRIGWFDPTIPEGVETIAL